MTATERDKRTDEGYASFEFNPFSGPERHVGESMAMYDDLREQHPSFFRSTSGPGFWVFTECALAREAFQQPAIFSNQVGPPMNPDQWMVLIPENLDPPVHTKWRQLLSPHFSPGRMAKMEDSVRSRAVALVDQLAPLGECDYVRDFAQIYPTSIFLDLMGIGIDRLEEFMKWEDDILHTPSTDEGKATAYAAMQAVTAMFAEVIEDRRRHPRDDLVSESLTWEIDGKPIPDEELLSFCLLMFMAGLDTVTNELSYATWHFATNPADRQRVLDEPELMPLAIEEVLRFYAIVTPPRRLTQDIDFHGCPMKAGDTVMMPITASTRDPREFDQADRFIVDRKVNNHIGFGAGPHRCLGSHLARREMRAALDAWHARIPNYSVPDGGEVREYVGVQLGMATLPIVWDT